MALVHNVSNKFNKRLEIVAFVHLIDQGKQKNFISNFYEIKGMQ